MFQVNKKLWSFNFGCIIASSYLWLVNWAQVAPVPEILHYNHEFIAVYYAGMVSAIGASLLTVITIIVMAKGFDICSSDYTFWFLLPSLCLLMLTAIASFSVLPSMLSAALPALAVMITTAFTCRLNKRKRMIFATNR